MTEPRDGNPPMRGVPNEALWAVMKELAAVSRAQARVTQRLIDLIETLPHGKRVFEREEREERGGQEEREERGGEHPQSDQHSATDGGAANSARLEGEAIIAPESPISSGELEEVVVEEDHPVAGNGGGLAAPALNQAVPLEDANETRIDPISIGIEGAGAGMADASAQRAGVSEGPAASSGGNEALDSVSEGPDEVEDAEGENEMVLTLESGNASVGVIWDQIVQIGPQTASTVPERITVDNDEVRLISLGNLLHGVSKEEKYFVVLEQDGERIGVACERMLGLGPIAGIGQMEQGARIPVLKVPFLRTFAGSARKEEKQDIHVTTQTPEEQDKQGPLRALVAVRYLPARVAICRHLRGRGWQVGEAAGLEEATVSLDLGRWDALFLEGPSNGEMDEVESTLLRRVLERRVTMIRVGSRLSQYPTSEGSGLMYPFSEAELDAILVRAGRRALA